MLIKLTSNTSGELVMFAQHARRLFEIIGKECTARGVFTFEQLPSALARLYQAVDEEKLATRLRANEERAGKSHADGAADTDAMDDDGDAATAHHAATRVGLAQRARPLINLMEWTVKEKGYILWEARQDF